MELRNMIQQCQMDRASQLRQEADEQFHERAAERVHRAQTTWQQQQGQWPVSSPSSLLCWDASNKWNPAYTSFSNPCCRCKTNELITRLLIYCQRLNIYRLHVTDEIRDRAERHAVHKQQAAEEYFRRVSDNLYRLYERKRRLRRKKGTTCLILSFSILAPILYSLRRNMLIAFYFEFIFFDRMSDSVLKRKLTQLQVHSL